MAVTRTLAAASFAAALLVAGWASAQSRPPTSADGAAAAAAPPEDSPPASGPTPDPAPALTDSHDPPATTVPGSEPVPSREKATAPRTKPMPPHEQATASRGERAPTRTKSRSPFSRQSDIPPSERRSLAVRMQRAHGMAEVGLGWLTLPGAEVCVQRGANPDCNRGDSSLALEAWQIFRLPSAFAVSGGVMLGLTPTTDAPPHEIPDVQRNHTRGYLTIEGMMRYYPYVGESVEGWLGLTTGLVVLSDTFSTVTPSGEQKPLIGGAGVVVRTEGGSLGMGGGLAYEFARNWTFGGNLRLGSWFLPVAPAESPFGDEASLVGQISWFVVTVNVAYRVQL